MKNKNGLVCGVGINDVVYSVVKYEKVNGKMKIVWRCPYYKKWVSMLVRCYSKKCQERNQTYKGCMVCEEWLTFSNFKKWMETQYWEDRELDKDFLIEDNNVYSPTTCVYLPSKLNNFITTSGKSRGLYPIGVRYMKKHKKMVNELTKPYNSRIGHQTGKILHLGMYSTPEEAHQVYLKTKLGYCEEYLLEFKDEELIVRGLSRIKDKIKHHIDNNLELTSY